MPLYFCQPMPLVLIKSDPKAREKPCIRCGYSLRKILERYAVERVIALAGTEGVRQLREVLAEMRDAAEAGSRHL